MDHNPAIGLVIGLPGRIGAVARIGLLVGPGHKQADAHAVKEPQDLHGVRVMDAQAVLQGRTVQALMSSVFDAPVLAVVSQESFGPHLAGLAAGRQPIDLGFGFRVDFFGVSVA